MRNQVDYDKNGKYLLTFILCLPLFMAGCSSTPVINTEPVATQPTPTPSPPVEQNQTPPPEQGIDTQTETVTSEQQTPADKPSQFNAGWVLTHMDGQSISTTLDTLEQFGIQEVQLGGDIITSIDDLILEPDKRRFIQNIIKQLEAKNVDTYVWSRELNLESATFRFKPNTPMAIARQAAYRYALENNPEIDGVVLSFSDAVLSPWDAEIPSGYPNLSISQRLRFLIDLVKSVVVDDFNKKLFIRFDSPTQQQRQDLARALDTYPANTLDLIVPVPLFLPYAGDPFQDFSPALQRHTCFAEYDLIGDAYGGPSFFYAIAEEMYRHHQSHLGFPLAGGFGIVQGRMGTLIETPNEVNAFALYHIFRGKPIVMDQIWDGWLNRRYEIFPASREGNLIKSILRHSIPLRRKMVLTQGIPLPTDTIPSITTGLDFLFHPRAEMNFPASYQPIANRLAEPDEQILTNVAQESSEAVRQTRQLQDKWAALEGSIPPPDYQAIKLALEKQNLMARVSFYAKQAALGYALWAPNYYEPEAFHLEAHLQNLEQLADRMANGFDSNHLPIASTDITAYVAFIREEFPTLLLGAEERDWNRIENVTIQQTGPQQIEIRWSTEQPSVSTVFTTNALPIFDRMQPATDTYQVDHWTRISGLQPQKRYYFRIQCKDGEGKTTSSGVYEFRLKGPAAL